MLANLLEEEEKKVAELEKWSKANAIVLLSVLKENQRLKQQHAALVDPSAHEAAKKDAAAVLAGIQQQQPAVPFCQSFLMASFDLMG